MQKPVTEKKKYFVVRERAVPEVLLKVVEAKKLLDSGKVDTVQDAAERTGISRSSFYKYKDDIFPFHEETRGKTITFIIQMDDEPGLLSVVLQTIARFHGNILTSPGFSCLLHSHGSGPGSQAVPLVLFYDTVHIHASILRIPFLF